METERIRYRPQMLTDYWWRQKFSKFFDLETPETEVLGYEWPLLQWTRFLSSQEMEKISLHPERKNDDILANRYLSPRSL